MRLQVKCTTPFRENTRSTSRFQLSPQLRTGKKEGAENNEADYHSWHAESLAPQKSQASKVQVELVFELRETVEDFEKDIMAIDSSVPEAVTWQELLEETDSDTELT